MTLKNSILATGSVVFGLITLTTGFIAVKGFSKLIFMEPITSTQMRAGQETQSKVFTLPKGGSVVVGLRYSIKSSVPNSPSKFSLPFEYRITDNNNSIISTQVVTVADDSGSKYMFSSSDSSEGWSSSATDLQPSISIHENVPYRITAKVSVPDSARYVPESLELRVFDGSDQVNLFRLTLMVVGLSMSGLIFLGFSIALWLSMRRKSAAVQA